ncbi:MAG: hypothetical protein NVSMB29_20340 [Candidatus Dormibacteria bacterium]
MSSVLDEILPIYRHSERHSTLIAYPPARVWRALHEVTNHDLWLTSLLMRIRTLPARLGGRSSRGGGTATDRSFVATFQRGGFCALRVDAPRSLVLGAAGQPWRLRGGESVNVVDLAGFKAFARKGFVLMVMSFELETSGAGTRLTTETRVQPTDVSAARAFRPYWWAIRGGSGLIRRDLLRAVRRRSQL